MSALHGPTVAAHQAVAEDAAGASAIAENQKLVASLLSLLQAPVDVSVRGRAAALIAELDAEEFHRPVVQVLCWNTVSSWAISYQSILHLLIASHSREGIVALLQCPQGQHPYIFATHTAQDAGAMHTVLSLVLTASSDEDYGEACWALLAAVARFMQTVQPPLEVLCLCWHLQEAAEVIQLLLTELCLVPRLALCRCFVRLPRAVRSW